MHVLLDLITKLTAKYFWTYVVSFGGTYIYVSL